MAAPDAQPVLTVDALTTCFDSREGSAVAVDAMSYAVGRQETLAQAWIDHRQTVPGTLEGATHEVIRLLGACPELVAVEEYSRDITPCERCRTQGPFRPGPPDRIVQALGYW